MSKIDEFNNENQDPLQNQENGHQKLTPRSKTISRMRKLLITGTAIGLTACESCHSVVCDPLPRPMECTEYPIINTYPHYVYWNAVWSSSTSGIVAKVFIYLNKNRLVFDGDPVVTGAKIISITKEKELIFECLPNPGVKQIQVNIPITCDQIKNKILFKLDISSPPKEGEPIRIFPGIEK